MTQYLNGIPIADTNPNRFDSPGCLDRDFEEHPLGCLESVGVAESGADDTPLSDAEIIDAINEINAAGGFPMHTIKAEGLVGLNQLSANFCWMFTSVFGIMLRRWQSGIFAPVLDAFAAAAHCTSGQNVGNSVIAGAKYLAQYGVPAADMVKFGDYRYDYTKEIEASAAKHKLIVANDFEADDRNRWITRLIKQRRPMGVNIPARKHAELLVGATVKGRDWFPVVHNSWGDDQVGDHGMEVLVGNWSVFREVIEIVEVGASVQ